MVLHLLNPNDVHTACRQRMESCELWLRRIIHDKFKKAFGENYFEDAKVGGSPIFPNRMKNQLQNLRSANPTQYSRAIDTLFLDDLGCIVGKADVYEEHFKSVFHAQFPLGVSHVKHVISSLVPMRNALSHANAGTLSLHDSERVFCYCNDLITAIKGHYSAMAEQDKFPAPFFVRYSDSTGTVWHPNPPRDHYASTDKSLYVGDEIRFEVEVDASFSPDEYEITWQVCNISQGESGKGNSFVLVLTPRHVGREFSLQVMVKSNKDWHRLQNMDGYLTMTYEVLPHPR